MQIDRVRCRTSERGGFAQALDERGYDVEGTEFAGESGGSAGKYFSRSWRPSGRE
jgi:hypothetical protein